MIRVEDKLNIDGHQETMKLKDELTIDKSNHMPSLPFKSLQLSNQQQIKSSQFKYENVIE